MAGWRSERTASSSMLRKTSSETKLTVSVEVVNVDAPKEADEALRNYAEQRRKDVEARKAMMEEVERVIKLIRDLRRNCEHYTVQIQTETTQRDEMRMKLDMIKEVVTSMLATIPKQYAESTDGEGQDALDDLGRLEAAVTRMLGAVSETEGQLHDMKQQVVEVNKEVSQARHMAEKFQRVLDGATCRLRDLVDKTDPRMSLLDLIKAAQKLLDDERKTTSEAEKALLPEKEKMDGMLDRRREGIKILRQLFERCAETDQLTKDLGCPIECPKEVNENKPMAGEFERALSWLIERTATVINELRTTRSRLSESEGKLRRAGSASKDGAEQMKLLQDNIRKLTDKLADLEKKIVEAGERKREALEEADKMQEAYEEEKAKLEAFQKREKSQWQQMAYDYNEHSKRVRQDLDKLARDVSGLREQTSELAIRVERALCEYIDLKKKLDEGKYSLSQANRDKEANIRKLYADLAAMEAETKEVDREGSEYADDANETRRELERRSGWQDGARNRFDSEKALREKQEAELTKLNDELARLKEKISSNEGNLEKRNMRYRDLQQKLNELCKKERELEKETQELRWARDEQYPGREKKQRGPCPTCPANAEAADQLPGLRMEYEQLEKEKAELADCEAKLRQEIEQKKDKAVVKKVEKRAKVKKLGPSSSTELPTDSPSRKDQASMSSVAPKSKARELPSKQPSSSVDKKRLFKQKSEVKTSDSAGESGTPKKKVERRQSGQSAGSVSSSTEQSGRKRSSRRRSTRASSAAPVPVEMSEKKQVVRRSSRLRGAGAETSSETETRTVTSQYAIKTRVSSEEGEDSSEESIYLKVTADIEVIEDESSGGSSSTATDVGDSDPDAGTKK